MRRAVLGGLTAVVLLTGVSAAYGAKSAGEVCGDVARKAQRTLWDPMRESGDAAFCRKGWLVKRPEELIACGFRSHHTRFATKLQNRWNALFQSADAEWATWGPRSIAADFEQGTIRGGFKRTFFGAGLAYSTSTIEVAKEGGMAEASITVCTFDYDGDVRHAEQKSFRSGPDQLGVTATFVLEHRDTEIIGVVVDTPVSINNFEYRARLLSEPTRNKLPAVKGVADLHVHQLADLAFAGRMYWGQSFGKKSDALAREIINPAGTGLDTSHIENFLQQLAASKSVDANLLFAVINMDTTDEGFFKYGGAGAPGFEDWPHHADRSHQGLYLDWLKAAHENNAGEHHNVNLVVVSLVNNDVLCSVAKLFDAYGNVPIRNSEGRITGWESAEWGCSDHENVQRQLLAMHEIEKDNPWYRIAMSPWHARQIIADGDLAVVVSMETDKPLSGKGGSYGNWEQQLDVYRSMGLTSMQMVHESNSRFCGAAPHRDMMTVLQLIHFPLPSVIALLSSRSTFQLDQQRYNTLGITEEGRKLVDAMVARNMPIDLAHGSQRCRRDVMARVGTDYGLYDSHTKFKRLLQWDGKCGEEDCIKDNKGPLDREQEFLITDEMIPEYRKHHVLIGLRPASIDVAETPDDVTDTNVENTCPGSSRSFAQLVQYASDQRLTFAYGTDFNTGVSQLGPRFGAQRCWAALKELKNRTRREVKPESEGNIHARQRLIGSIAGTNYYTDGMAVYGYLAMWERTYPPEGTAPAPNEERPKCKNDGDCGSGQWCNAGVDIAQNKCEAKKDDGEACPAVGGGHACKSGQCMWGHCYTPASVAMGGTCYVDGACRNGRCSAWDGARGICVCRDDGDCGSGFWCDAGLDLKLNACKAKLDDGAFCGTVGELSVGHRCKSGDCKVWGASLKLKCK